MRCDAQHYAALHSLDHHPPHQPRQRRQAVRRPTAEAMKVCMLQGGHAPVASRREGAAPAWASIQFSVPAQLDHVDPPMPLCTDVQPPQPPCLWHSAPPLQSVAPAVDDSMEVGAGHEQEAAGQQAVIYQPGSGLPGAPAAPPPTRTCPAPVSTSSWRRQHVMLRSCPVRDVWHAQSSSRVELPCRDGLPSRPHGPHVGLHQPCPTLRCAQAPMHLAGHAPAGGGSAASRHNPSPLNALVSWAPAQWAHIGDRQTPMLCTSA